MSENQSILRRRYQVFVSSTYEDLKEERKHVIQSLLETKCIPTGMELFPASSVEQWGLIKRVIDESDYYIVIVAGRYGSLGKDGRSFTEMEFDYAVQTGKPVIGFYHENVMELPGKKLEKLDAGREALQRFTEKVKSRLCRPWSSPDALGSAIKSAILNEIEFNPQPGWVRADAQDNSDIVLKLKQRVSTLEESLKRVSGNDVRFLPEGEELIKVQVEILSKSKLPHSDNPWKFDESSQELIIPVPWKYLFIAIANKARKPMGAADVSALIKQSAISFSGVRLESCIPEDHKIASTRIPKELRDNVLDRLIADNLLEEVATKVNDGYKTRINTAYKLTKKGVRYAATKRAEESKA